jgi:hypothetical protein
VPGGKYFQEGRMSKNIGRWAGAFGAGLAALLVARAATAQMPASPEAAAIAECLCLKEAVDRAGVEMTVKRRGLDQVRAELARIDAELNSERTSLNVNDPQAVAQFRQKLEKRDELFRRSNGDVVVDVAAAVKRYNALVEDYNHRCSGRPMDPVLMSQIQANLVCPSR